jgi:hypothetical protein
MAARFSERDTHQVDSPGRDAAAQRVLELWLAEGE